MIVMEISHPLAKAPMKSTPGSSGYDLYSIEKIEIQAGQRVMIDTGVRICTSPDIAPTIKPRSKLSNKFGLDLLGGVGDSDYEGTYKVILLNTGVLPVHINVGDAIAQMVFYKIAEEQPEIGVVIKQSQRGESGIDEFETRTF